MRYYAISDNVDTQTGLRLAGIECCLAHQRKETQAAITDALSDPGIGILLITEGLAKSCRDFLDAVKQRKGKTVVVEIPDRHGTGRSPDSITRVIREAIGVRV